MWIGILFILLSSFNFYLYNVHKNESRIDALLKSWLIIWSYILVLTEFLSCFHGFTRNGVFLGWIIFFVFSCYWGWSSRDRLVYALNVFRDIPLSGILFLILLAGTFCCGISYLPNNWDSMTYHLGRVSMWIQNKGVQFYDTPILRQNYQLPLAEYGIAHLSLLTKDDRFAFLIQWMSLICASAGTARITELLGGSFQAKWRTMFLCASIPMAIYQASSTQNDLVVTAFLVIFVRFLLEFSSRTVIWTGIAFGLTLMTKGTAYIYTAVIGTGLGLYQVISASTRQRRKLFLFLCMAVVIGIIFPSGFFYRNFNFFGKILGGASDEKYLVASASPKVYAVNFLRHCALHMATPVKKINNYITQCYYHCFPDTVNHPDSTWHGSKFSIHFLLHEDYMGNTVHAALFAVFLILLLFSRRDLNKSILFYTSIMLFSMLVFFSVITWNEWLSRLHTPLFLLFIPVLAIVPDQYKYNGKWVLPGMDGVLFLIAAGCLYYCNPRPLFPFVSHFSMKPDESEAAVNSICAALPEERPLHIGIICGANHRVYFLFRKMHIHACRNPDIRMDFDSNAPYLICIQDHLPKKTNHYLTVCNQPPFLLLKKKNIAHRKLSQMKRTE